MILQTRILLTDSCVKLLGIATCLPVTVVDNDHRFLLPWWMFVKISRLSLVLNM